ncbi:hypothetical protein HaLaN_22928 [Haematococcus lacustris]|uniref:Uncharacterized protein n=1 Tax=Haematococcus lacustris TaxID=44745 RepID=A0A699ZSY3_HAELA|nr:hypothetical protein HaLaN_22928 [Haematococcus lacustris]
MLSRLPMYSQTFPVAFLVYLSRIFVAARDLVQVPRDSINVAIASLNLVILISTNPINCGFPATPPAFNAAVLNLIRTITSALSLTFAILNLIQSILELIADELAVPPAAIALVTGPILFGVASVEYYNALVAAFPAVPNGYLNDLNTALGGLGSGLTGNVFLGSSGGPLRTALGSLRTSLGTLGTAQGTLRGLTGGLARA